jgi:hypothetical protein
VTRLTKQFTEQQYAKALSSWTWLDGLDRLTPGFASLFGDLFLLGEKGAWWFLDTLEGTLSREWTHRDDLVAALGAEAGQDRYLMGGLALGAGERRKLKLEDDQVYGWAPPPMIARNFAVDDIKAFPFVVVVHVAGQFHGQRRDPS